MTKKEREQILADARANLSQMQEEINYIETRMNNALKEGLYVNYYFAYTSLNDLLIKRKGLLEFLEKF